MPHTDGYKRACLARDKSRKIAVEAVLAHEVQIQDWSGADFSTLFGSKWASRFTKVRSDLIEKYGVSFSDLIELSIREYIYSIVSASSLMRLLLADCVVPSDPSDWRLTTPDGYADSEGMAYTLFNGLGEIDKPADLLKGTVFNEFPSGRDILEAMAVVWFIEAVASNLHDAEKSANLLFEAADALNLANGLFMWDEGAKVGGENPASAMAKLRHAENYALAKDAAKHWKENISPKLSAERAATALEKVVPLSHKKLAEIVSIEKKKASGLRRAEPERKA